MAHEAKLRKVGGSVMLTIPPPLLNELGLAAEGSVDLAVRSGRLVVAPKARPRYSLDALLRETRSSRRAKDKAWVSGGRVGRELI